MKILIVIPTLSSGGTERFASNLANYFSYKDHKVKILKFENKEPFYDLNSDIEVVSVGYSINRKNRIYSIMSIAINVLYKSTRFVRHIVKNSQPDIVIPFLPQADIAVYLSGMRSEKFKIICSERNDPTKRSKVMQIILKKIYRNADILVCQSKKVKEFYNCVSNDKKIVIANPIDPNLIPTQVEENSCPVIVGVGRLDYQKNFSLLIDSFSVALKYIPPETQLIIYGEGRLREKLESQVRELNLIDNVKFPGICNDLFNKIKDASLFVMSSDYEGFPNALLEAMVLGLPVISTDFPTGTARELITIENGRLVEVGNNVQMKNAIVELMNDTKTRKKMRENNRRMLEKFTIDNIAKKWNELIMN
ncbi:MAG: glycosyltransferase [bacterium]|nr:glycosyltransferase [bacterium]